MKALKTALLAIVFTFALSLQAQFDPQADPPLYLTGLPPIDIIAAIPTSGDLKHYVKDEGADRIYIVKLYVDFPVDSAVAYLSEWGSEWGRTCVTGSEWGSEWGRTCVTG